MIEFVTMMFSRAWEAIGLMNIGGIPVIYLVLMCLSSKKCSNGARKSAAVSPTPCERGDSGFS